MRNMTRHAISIVMICVLSACQKPTTYGPKATAEEIAAEQTYQSQLAEQQIKRTKKNTLKPEAQLLQEFAQVAENVQRVGVDVCEEMGIPQLERSCFYDFQISKEDKLNAYADGQKVVVFMGMLNFVETKDELAVVLAHELAHNLMGHPDSTRSNVTLGAVLGTAIDALATSQGYNTQGLFAQQGMQAAQLRYSKAFEQEADYVSLYILARAGYDLGKAPHFWRHMAVENPQGIYNSMTHPTTAERFVTLKKTINEIQSKKQLKLALLPERVVEDE